MTSVTNRRLVPLAEAAAGRQLNRERMLRRAMEDGSAVQQNGRWFVVVERQERIGDDDRR